MYKIEIKKTGTLRDENVKPVRTSMDAVKIVLPLFPKEDSFRESFYAVFLDRRQRPIGNFLVGVGGTDKVTVDLKLICAAALGCLAAGVILAHNHPSGNPVPGQADIQQTEAIKKALSLFDICLLDHIVIGEKEYFSFGEEVKKRIPKS